MNRFSTNILFVPVEDRDGKYWLNVANIAYYFTNDAGNLEICMSNGESVLVNMTEKDFTNMLRGEAKPK